MLQSVLKRPWLQMTANSAQHLLYYFRRQATSYQLWPTSYELLPISSGHQETPVTTKQRHQSRNAIMVLLVALQLLIGGISSGWIRTTSYPVANYPTLSDATIERSLLALQATHSPASILSKRTSPG
ncbi:hypothetical protein P152DRAFT_311503 [Eremomyces bilateralis CBS 781.70]|uniref:Uncharacterized protein n=1 Tax=Eremomyces bilateralis CBS 781.70 TaxID=1392243 RepID=A0A6G1G5V9_9PEZI|nr:uncharacterized protein P152DRAFT_311503 [Eremomyces bilateralis CBS 781.70]KAF1813260.1 hypothetical protein P152DRAFT_311503 [Eremomyces bilateralis CBS 781.70]